MSEAAASAAAAGSAEILYAILKSNIIILRKWAENPDNEEYIKDESVKYFLNNLNKFDTLNETDNEAIQDYYSYVDNFITKILRPKIPIDKWPKGLADAELYDGGRRRKSASSSSRPRRRSSKKRGTQRKQKRRQRRGSRRAY